MSLTYIIKVKVYNRFPDGVEVVVLLVSVGGYFGGRVCAFRIAIICTVLIP